MVLVGGVQRVDETGFGYDVTTMLSLSIMQSLNLPLYRDCITTTSLLYYAGINISTLYYHYQTNY